MSMVCVCVCEAYYYIKGVKFMFSVLMNIQKHMDLCSNKTPLQLCCYIAVVVSSSVPVCRMGPSKFSGMHQ
jgi:hypothetical protein